MSLRENVEAGLWQSELAAASHREALGKWTLLSGLHHPASPTMDVDPHTAPSGLDLVLIVCIGTPTSSTYNHSVTESGLSTTVAVTTVILISTDI